MNNSGKKGLHAVTTYAGNITTQLTLMKMANGAITPGCDSTRSDSTSREASASEAKPLPM